uniref:Leukocyte surface antigen CD53 n=1 Tax=Oncorhynchus tshawytscha TaxID=74940 RepID=A0A8C8H4G0_ONCTS
MDTIMSYDTIFCMMYVDAMLLCLGQMCGTAVFGFGVFLMLNTKVSALIPTLSTLNLANTLFITGIIITCVSFLGFLGALKENRCLLITFFILLFILMLVELTVACLLLVYEKEIDRFLEKDLTESLMKSRERLGHHSGHVPVLWDPQHK